MSNQEAKLRGVRVLMLLDNPCDPDPRVTREAEALVAAGAQVVVLAWHREGGAARIERRGGLEIRRLPPPTGRHMGWRQMTKLSRLYRNAWREVATLSFDVVVAHDFLMLPLGATVARRAGVPLVYDAHEIYRWMDAGRLPDAWLVGAEKLEQQLIDRAVDLFVTVSEQRVESYWRHRVRKRPVVVGNWYDPVHVDRRAARRQLDLTDVSGKLVGYAGSLNRNRRIDLLLDLARLRPDVTVVVAGRGDAVTVGQVRRAAEELANVRYLGWLDDAVTLLGACDALFYALDPSVPYNRYAAPNTLYIAIALDRPLLAIAGGEVADLARQGSGISLIERATPRAFADAVDALESIEPWGELRQQYTWAKAADRYVAAVATLFGDDPQPRPEPDMRGK